MSYPLLIADCGGSKGDWRLIDADGGIAQRVTRGINPYYQTDEEITERLKEGLIDLQPAQIIFYGAGCGRAERSEWVRNVLAQLWPEAEIAVYSDVLGSARAACGPAPGIACILGTGSNACYFDGKEVQGQAPNLGFWLGDEGSGGHLGKILLSRYLTGQMPPELSARFNQRYPGDLSHWLNLIYDRDKPANASIAALAKFAFDHRSHPFIASLIMENFSTFLTIYVKPLMHQHGPLPVHFTGSIAFYYNSFVQEAVEQMGYSMGRVLEKPISGLSLYHTQQL